MSSTVNDSSRETAISEAPADAARAPGDEVEPAGTAEQPGTPEQAEQPEISEQAAIPGQQSGGWFDLIDDAAAAVTTILPVIKSAEIKTAEAKTAEAKTAEIKTGGVKHGESKRVETEAPQSAPSLGDLFPGPLRPTVPAEPPEPPDSTAPSAPAAPAGLKPKPAPVVPPPTAKPGSKVSWREAVPYEETGILIRPADWSTDRVETALINVASLRAGKADGDAAAQAPRRKGLMRFVPVPRRGVLMLILLIQALLSLRNSNTAFEDEALYLYSGHLELAHLVYGQPVDDFASYFSGAPVLYPVAGAFMDQLGGLFAARLLSLTCMLAATCLVYLIGRRLFGTKSALCGAALFGTTASAIFMGGFATYDAPAVFLLALAGWIVVRGASSSWPYYVVAVFPLVLAVGTKYASLLFVPTVIVLAGVSALPHQGWRWALVRPVSLTLMVASMAYGALRLAGPTYVHGIEQTTTNRAQGGTSTQTLLTEIAKWGAPVFAAALLGAFYYVFRPRADDPVSGPRLSLFSRAAMASLMLGTALLAPVNQLRIHTDVALQKHIGFGLLFAAPLAGYGVVRLVGRHFGRLQLGIGIGVLAFAFGMSQSHIMFRGWANATTLVSTIVKYQQPNAHYLVEIDEVPIYYLRGDTEAEPGQFTSTFAFTYVDLSGQVLNGNAAYKSAAQQGYFQLIAFDQSTTPDVDNSIMAGMYAGGLYRKVASIPEQTAYGVVTYQVWIKK